MKSVIERDGFRRGKYLELSFTLQIHDRITDIINYNNFSLGNEEIEDLLGIALLRGEILYIAFRNRTWSTWDNITNRLRNQILKVIEDEKSRVA